jgi:hypothetical protein
MFIGWDCAACWIDHNFGNNGVLAKYIVFQEVGNGRYGYRYDHVPLADIYFWFSKF